MDWWAWLGIAAAIIGILWAVDAWLLPEPKIRPFILRLFGKGEKPSPPVPIQESSQPATIQIQPPPSGTGRTVVTVTVDYVDGLPQAPPQIRDPFEQAYSLMQSCQYQKAIELFEACFQPEATPSHRTALHILLGNCFMGLSELEEAEGHYRQAESLARKESDREGRAAALGNMGIVYEIRGELDRALEHHKQALRIHRDTGNREGEASALGNMGIVYEIRGELDRALTRWSTLQISHRFG